MSILLPPPQVAVFHERNCSTRLEYYGAKDLHAHAAAVSAAECEPLMAEIEALRQDGSRLAAENAALRAELLQEHADHKQTVEDAMGSVQANAALRAELDEWRFTNKVDELDRSVTRQAERIKVLESALERTATALNLAYSKKPLRDMAETLAEARAALGDKNG